MLSDCRVHVYLIALSEFPLHTIAKVNFSPINSRLPGPSPSFFFVWGQRLSCSHSFVLQQSSPFLALPFALRSPIVPLPWPCLMVCTDSISPLLLASYCRGHSRTGEDRDEREEVVVIGNYWLDVIFLLGKNDQNNHIRWFPKAQAWAWSWASRDWKQNVVLLLPQKLKIDPCESWTNAGISFLSKKSHDFSGRPFPEFVLSCLQTSD